MPPKSVKRSGARIARRDPVALRLELTLLALDRTPAQVFRETGIAANAMSQYLSGKRRITVQQALKLKSAYGVALDWLYAGDRSQLPSGLAAKIAALLSDPGAAHGNPSWSKAGG